jgi:drug/metabolite transporter (DMT)-like permease
MSLVTGYGRKLIVPRDTWISVLAIGLLNGVGAVGFWAGLERIDPTFSAMLGRTLPVLCILGGVVFYGERFRRVEVLPVLLILVGGVVAVAGRPPEITLGAGLTLGGCVMGASQFILAKRIVHRVDVGALTAWRMIFAIPIVVIWAWSTRRMDVSAAEPTHWGAALLGAFLVSYLSRWLSFHAYRNWPLAYASVVDATQPLFVLPQAYLLLHQLPTTQGMVGGGLILAGALTFALVHSRANRKEQQILPRVPSAR